MPSRASMMELYCKNSNQLAAIFPKSSIIHTRMGSKSTSQKTEIVKIKVIGWANYRDCYEA